MPDRPTPEGKSCHLQLHNCLKNEENRRSHKRTMITNQNSEDSGRQGKTLRAESANLLEKSAPESTGHPDVAEGHGLPQPCSRHQRQGQRQRCCDVPSPECGQGCLRWESVSATERPGPPQPRGGHGRSRRHGSPRPQGNAEGWHGPTAPSVLPRVVCSPRSPRNNGPPKAVGTPGTWNTASKTQFPAQETRAPWTKGGVQSWMVLSQ